jgi:peptidyl-prolyl cis-trans isomerase C
MAAVLLATSGCSKEATGQSVAVVNGEEVSLSELNAELSQANVPESADKKQVLPQLLQRIIDRRVLAQKAVEEGVDRSPEYIARQRRMNEELLIGLYTKRQSDAMKAPTPQEIDRFIAENPGMFAQRAVLSLDQLQFDRPADMTLLQQMANDKTLDQVGATLTRLGIPFTRSKGRLDTATVPPQMLKQITDLPAGEPFVVPVGQRIVASVITGREAATISSDQNRRIAAEALRRQKLMATMEKQLKDIRANAKIEYQSGYAPPANAGKAQPAPGTKKSS